MHAYRLKSPLILFFLKPVEPVLAAKSARQPAIFFHEPLPHRACAFTAVPPSPGGTHASYCHISTQISPLFKHAK